MLSRVHPQAKVDRANQKFQRFQVEELGTRFQHKVADKLLSKEAARAAAKMEDGILARAQVVRTALTVAVARKVVAQGLANKTAERGTQGRPVARRGRNGRSGVTGRRALPAMAGLDRGGENATIQISSLPKAARDRIWTSVLVLRRTVATRDHKVQVNMAFAIFSGKGYFLALVSRRIPRKKYYNCLPYVPPLHMIVTPDCFIQYYI